MSSRRLVLMAVAVLGAVLGVAFAPAFIHQLAFAAKEGVNAANREEVAKLSQQEQLSRLFREVAKLAQPAVVEVRVKKRVAVPSADDFVRRYFGDEDQPVPGPFRRPSPRAPRRDGGEGGNGERFQTQNGLGSGVIVDEKAGYILTNWHVVGGADEVEIITTDGRRFETDWIRGDAQSDIAVLKLKGQIERLSSLPLGDSAAMDVGDLVLAVGSPEGLPQTVTSGIISAKQRTTGGRGYEDFLQTDASINHGNSGGPLVNMRAEIIGINTAIVSRTGVNEGIGLAIPSNMAKTVMRQLVEKGKVTRGYLGVTIQDVDERLARSFGLGESKGALVTGVQKGSPADKAGVQEEDFIVAVGGKPIENVNELRNRIADVAPGKQIEITVIRQGKKQNMKVEIAVQPAEMSGRPETQPEGEKAKDLGFEVETFSEQLAARFKYPAGAKGVIVADVDEGGEAAEAGLRPGMLVDRVGERAVTSVAEFRAAVASAQKEGGAVRLRIGMPDGGRRYMLITPR